MLDVSEILTVFHAFRERVSVSSIEFSCVKSSGLEFETKLHINDIATVEAVLAGIESLGILKLEHRFERHALYEGEDGSHVCTINVPELNTLWIKTKTRNLVRLTPSLAIPLVSRTGKKYKPTESGYSEIHSRLEYLLPLHKFDKDCINVYFSVDQHIFSLSFSLARNTSGFRQFEMEFEYEGSSLADGKLNQQEIFLLFEKLFLENFPSLISDLHAETKYERLALQLGN